MKPNIGDIIELVTDIPPKNLRAGVRGAIVHCHGDDAYEVEFTDDNGETLDSVALYSKDFIVVWRAETRQWVSIPEQTSVLVASLPDDAAKEVFDFARFLSLRYCQPGTSFQAKSVY